MNVTIYLIRQVKAAAKRFRSLDGCVIQVRTVIPEHISAVPKDCHSTAVLLPDFGSILDLAESQGDTDEI